MIRGDLSIAQRLGIGFGLLFAVLAALLGSVYHWQSRSAAVQERFVQRTLPLQDASVDLQNAVLQTGIAVRAFLLDPGALTLQGFQARRTQAQVALERLRGLPKEEKGEALYLRLAPLVLTYIDAARRAVDAPRDAGIEARLASARSDAVGAVEEFTQLQKGATVAALQEMEAARTAASRGLLYAGGAALASFLLLALLIGRSIRRPAKALLGVASALQAGNWQPALAYAPKALDAETRAAPRDEMLKLGQAFGAAAEALERREQRLRADRQVAAVSGRTLDRRALATSALQAVCEHVGAEVGAFYWHSGEEGAGLEPVALRALGEDALQPLAFGEGLPGQAARERRILVVRDIPADTPFAVKLGYDAAPPKCIVAVPVALRDELLGVVVAASLRPVEAEALAFLEDAAAQLAVGLANVKAYEKIRELLAELEHKSVLLQDQNEELQAQTEEIQAQNEELQTQGEEIQAQNDQLKEQAHQLRAFADSLSEADRRKNEFLGVLAHELRNPMAAIGNSLYTLANSTRPEHRRRAEEVIGRQTRLLTRLVDDLLDVTRIARGKVQLQKESLELAGVLRDCVEDYRAAADKAGVALELKLPEAEVVVEGDRARLCQIVGNLLDNAIKFAGGAAPVKVELAVRGGDAEVSVADRGMGMDGEMLARLFQPFSQADTSLARRKGGLGLGLALSKALAELHGGSVHASSEGLGKGAQFVVRLPLAVAISAAAEVRQPSPAGRARRVLIVEDNSDAAHTLRDAVELFGHEVRVAADADEALVAAGAFAPEVLLCDIGLPTLDGYELAQRLRADERFRSMFMIAVTGYAGPDDQQRAARAGFDRHFGKPPDLERLAHLLSEFDAGAGRLAHGTH